MKRMLRSFSGVLGVAIASTVWVGAARAQDNTRFQPFAEEFNRAATRSSGNALKNQSLMRQLSVFLGVSYPWPNGINGFPETLLTDDARRLNDLHREAMLEQTSSDRVIRTPDLINPYNTSILTQPSLLQDTPVAPAGEFLYR
ncbi:MAG: hypothetical protein ACP5D7_01610 [Limnospira sp.]